MKRAGACRPAHPSARLARSGPLALPGPFRPPEPPHPPGCLPPGQSPAERPETGRPEPPPVYWKYAECIEGMSNGSTRRLSTNTPKAARAIQARARPRTLKKSRTCRNRA